MKLVRGLTLSALLGMRSNPQEKLERFIGIFEQICHAVGYAHAHRVLHRDLKPGNVMVGKYGEVQLMDWGLAKILGEENPNKDTESPPDVESTIDLYKSEIDTPHAGSSATKTGDVLGTIAYMAPEQASGEIRSLDARSDVFGLGAILCQILIGRPPYAGRDYNELRIKAIRGDLRETLELLHLAPVEAELVNLCKRCLSLKMEDRPADGQSVAKEVEQFRAQTEARARQAELDRKAAEIRVAEEAKRRKQWLISAAIVAATLLIGMTISGIGLLRAQAATKKERLTAKAAQDSEAKAIKLAEKEKNAQRVAQAMTDETIVAYNKMIFEIQSRLQLYPELSELRTSLLNAAQKGLAGARGQFSMDSRQVRSLAWIDMELGDIALNQENTREAEKKYLSAEEIAKAYFQSNPKEIKAGYSYFASQSRLGKLRNLEGQNDDSLKYFQSAGKVAQLLMDLDPKHVDALTATASSSLDTGDALIRLGRASEAESHFNKSLTANQQLVALDAANLIARKNSLVCCERLGDLEFKRGQVAKATAIFESKRDQELALLRDAPEDRWLKRNLSLSYERLGNFLQKASNRERVLDYYQRSLLLCQEIAIPPIIPEYQRGLAGAYEQLGNYFSETDEMDTAVEWHLKAVKIREQLEEKSVGNERSKNDLCINYNNLGKLSKRQRDYKAAAAWFGKAAKIIEELSAKGKADALDQPMFGWIPHNLAVCQKAEQAISDLDYAFTQQSLEQVQELAIIYVKDRLHQQKLDKALECTERLVKWIDDISDEQARREPYYAAACAYALCAAGEIPDEALVDKAITYLSKVETSGYFREFPASVDHLNEDEDLRAIQKHPKFVQFVEGVRKAKATTGASSGR